MLKEEQDKAYNEQEQKTVKYFHLKEIIYLKDSNIEMASAAREVSPVLLCL